MTREQIANRIREEHAKHPTLDWADIAARKILANMRDERQPSPDGLMNTELLSNLKQHSEIGHEDARRVHQTGG